MAIYRTQILSALPQTEVFDYVADMSNAATWDPGVAKAIRCDDGPITVGSAFDLDIRLGKRVTPMTYVVLELNEPTKVVLRSETKRLVSLDTITVRNTAAGTILNYHADLQLKGLGKVVAPLLAIMFKRIGDAATEGLREHIT